MQLGQIRAFLAVRETGSLRAAARQIGISQPAISKALAGLEADLQAELFIRTSRCGVRLTEAGRLFGARAAVVLAELGRAREELSELRGGSEGWVSFGFGPASMALAPDAIARFPRRATPGAHPHPRGHARRADAAGARRQPRLRHRRARCPRRSRAAWCSARCGGRRS